MNPRKHRKVKEFVQSHTLVEPGFKLRYTSLVPRSGFITCMLCLSSTLCRPPSQAPKPPRSQQLHSKETGGRKHSQLNGKRVTTQARQGCQEHHPHQTHLTQDQEEAGHGGQRGSPQWQPGMLELARGKRKGYRRGQGVSSRGKSTGQDGRQEEKGGLGHGNQRGGRGASAQRATDLLLAGTDALGVEVPVRVEVADGHPQVLHSDHGAVGQVWEEEGSRWCELAQGGCGS